MNRHILKLPIITGISLRLALVIFLIPILQRDLFIPFLTNSVNRFSIDVWQSWIDTGGRLDVFPYGLGMLLPLLVVASVSNLLAPDNVGAMSLGIGIFLIFVDFMIFRLLQKSKDASIVSVWVYALGPLAIYISFVHGQLDILPTFYFLTALILLENRKWKLAGVIIAIAISAKFSFILVLPFFLVFFFDNPRFRQGQGMLVKSFAVTFALTQFPLLFLEGYRQMVIATPEVQRIFMYGIDISQTTRILIFPVIYISLLYWLWRVGRSTTSVLITFAGAALLSVAISAPSAIGWYVWSIPILAILAGKRNNFYSALFLMTQLTVLIAYQGKQTNSEFRFNAIDDLLKFSYDKSLLIQNTSETLAIVFGGILVVSILRRAISQSDVYGFSRKPMTIAIAGDSGAGKDTLSESIATILGPQSTTFILGDDYHLFERGDSMWSTKTHLNPKANNLSMMNADFVKAAQRKPVMSRHYDHEIGRFTKPRLIKPADFVLANGLHALMLKSTQELIDLKVFIEMEEEARRYLKVKRDTFSRSVPAQKTLDSLEERATDSIKYVQPQRSQADLVINMWALDQRQFEAGDEKIKFGVSCSLVDLELGDELTRNLRSISNVDVRFKTTSSNSSEMTLDPTGISGHDYEVICRRMIINYNQFFVDYPKFESGTLEFASLIVLLGLAERRFQGFGD